MIWPFKRDKDNSFKESEKALIEAKQHLTKARKRQDEVQEVAGALREFRQANHIAEQLYSLLGGNPP